MQLVTVLYSSEITKTSFELSLKSRVVQDAERACVDIINDALFNS